jgi:hypothetical protein
VPAPQETLTVASYLATASAGDGHSFATPSDMQSFASPPPSHQWTTAKKKSGKGKHKNEHKDKDKKKAATPKALCQLFSPARYDQTGSSSSSTSSPSQSDHTPASSNRYSPLSEEQLDFHQAESD